MKTLRVRDIMSNEVQTLSTGTTVAQAAAFLTERRVGGVPVTDGGRLVGVVSKSDLVDPKSGLSTGGSRPINEVMTHLTLTVRPDDSVMLAVRRMLDAGIHRVVVVDEDGKLSGILSPTDVLRAVERGDVISEDAPGPAGSVVDLRTFEVRI